MFPALEIISVTFEVAVLLIYLKSLFGRFHTSVVKLLLITVIGGGGFLVLRSVHLDPGVRLVYVLLSVTLGVRLLFGVKLLNGFYSAVLLMAVTFVANALSVGLISLFGYPTGEIVSKGVIRAVYLGLDDIFLVTFVAVVSKGLKHRADHGSFRDVLPLLLCQLLGAVLGALIFTALVKMNYRISAIYFVGVLGILYLVCVLYVFIDRLKVAGEFKRQSALAEQQMTAQLEYFDQQKDQQKETLALWQDIEKYLAIMRDMLARQELEQARQCLNHVTGLYREIGPVIDVGDTMLSAILNHSVQKARRLGFDAQLDVWVPPRLMVLPTDLSVIIGTACDWTLEAGHKQNSGGGMLHIQFKQKNSMVFLEVKLRYTNASTTYLGVKEKDGKSFQSIRRCVDKYSGTLLVEAAPQSYTVTVSLNVSSDEMERAARVS